MRSRTLAMLVLLLLGACTPAQDSGPDLSTSEIGIYRDEWGVPHIYAGLEEDGFYGLGYAMAQDQLERTLRTVLYARGELSKAFGPQLQPGMGSPLFVDYMSKLWRIHEVSAESVERLDPQLRQNYAGFIAGFRAYMEAHPERVPDWAPRDLSVADAVAMPRAGLWLTYQAGIGIGDCRRGGAPMLNQIPDTGPGSASNVWAVMPERTATGGAILLTDPHGGIDGRFSYEYRVHAGELRSAGFAFGPMMIVARNARVGWGMTTGSPDVADCFVFETDPANPRTYLYDGEPQSIEAREIVIEVNGEDPVTAIAEYTRHNGYLSPVVARDGTKAYVVSTAYMDDAAPFHNALYRMNHAATVDELRDAMSNNGVFPQNVLAADTAGDILFVHAGETPIRPNAAVDWMRPVDGNSSATAWKGIHPLDDLLVIRSPSSGYLQNNNVDPNFMADPPPAELEGKPGYILNAGLIPVGRRGDRSIRTLELLAQHQRMTREDAFAVALDAKLPGTEDWLGLLSRAAESASLEGADAAYVDGLLAFDGRLEAESSAALKYVYWREALRVRLSPADYRALLAPLWNDGELPEELAGKLVAAAREARDRLVAVHGDPATNYGDEFRVGGDDGESWPLSGGTLAQGPECSLHPLMCPTSLLAFYYTPRNPATKQRIALGGSRIRRLDFYGPDGIESYTMQNPGLSDDPESGHTDDQAEQLTGTGEMKKIRFDWRELEPHVVERVTLEIKAP
ncbi:hypothetical protein ABI59_19115 [Acidobacteria bacterium Mor1]|nr:hypothetical protein ABI59_19115 [Acidobacteria bacterium Mor1]